MTLLLATVGLREEAWAVVEGLPQNFTVPTRTPTAPPPPPTAPPAPTSPPGDDNNPPPTATRPVSAPTATPAPLDLAPTPVGGFVPTAEACSDQPTLETLGETNVRSGPDTSFEVIGSMVFLEVRRITARAANAEWWQVELADGRLGWVADSVVLVQGNISVVPTIQQAEVTGVPWFPTITPGCSIEPVWTAVPSQSIETEANPPVAPPTQPPAATASPTATTIPITPVGLAINQTPEGVVGTGGENMQATAVPLMAGEQTAPPSSRLFPVMAAIALALGGAGLFLWQRRRGPTS